VCGDSVSITNDDKRMAPRGSDVPVIHCTCSGAIGEKYSLVAEAIAKATKGRDWG
jgi:hypothetical protein